MNKLILSMNLMAVFVIALFMLTFIGCTPEESEWPQGKEIFEKPPWLGGTNIETLEKDSLKRYSIFLELMEKANYTVPIEKQLFTLFVPENESFLKYFSSIGKTGVADLSQQEAVQLFTLHVLRNPRSKYHLVYEHIWGEEQGPKGEYASLFFRKPTKSFSLPKVEVRKYNTSSIDQEYLVFSDNKYLPIFSTNFFSDYFGSSDGSDYLCSATANGAII